MLHYPHAIMTVLLGWSQAQGLQQCRSAAATQHRKLCMCTTCPCTCVCTIYSTVHSDVLLHLRAAIKLTSSRSSLLCTTCLLCIAPITCSMPLMRNRTVFCFWYSVFLPLGDEPQHPGLITHQSILVCSQCAPGGVARRCKGCALSFCRLLASVRAIRQRSFLQRFSLR